MEQGTNSSFEERLNDVQKVIDGIESGKLSLEDAVHSYEEGMKSLDLLETELKELKRRLFILEETAEGPAEVPFLNNSLEV